MKKPKSTTQYGFQDHPMNPIGKEHFIFSVENPLHPPKTQAPSHEEMLSWLKEYGENAYEAMGHYGQPERSIVVIQPKNVDLLHKLAENFGQESVIYSKDHNHELRYINGPNKGKIVRGRGSQTFSEKPKDMYTAIKDQDGNTLYFQHNFDFD